MSLKLLSLLLFFIGFLFTYSIYVISLEMLDEKDNPEYKATLGKRLQLRAVEAAACFTGFVACLIYS